MRDSKLRWLEVLMIGVVVICMVLSLLLGWVPVHTQVEAQTLSNMRPMVGSQGNLWAAAAVGIAGTSTALDTRGFQMCTLFGNSTATATVMTVQVSADGTAFYSTEASTTTGATGDFGVYLGIGARYIRLLAAAAGTVTATAQCKS